MNKILGRDGHIGWEEIVLNSWVHLHDVSALSSNLYVHDPRISKGGRAFFESEHVRSVLECTPVLSSINGKTHGDVQGTNVNCRVLFHWRFDTVLSKTSMCFFVIIRTDDLRNITPGEGTIR